MQTKESPMKHLRFLSVSAATLLLAASYSLAGDIKVIANASVAADAISVRELKSVFLGEENRLGGVHVEPVFEKNGQVHDAFLREYLRQSDAELQAYYRALVVTGRGEMPKALASDAEVVAYVAKTKGAIGYVGIDVPVAGVKVLTVLQAGASVDRKLVTRVEPDYPETLQHLQIGGTVRLTVTISPKGSVDDVKLLGGNPILAEAAIKAVMQWVYAPNSARSTQDVSIPFIPKR